MSDESWKFFGYTVKDLSFFLWPSFFVTFLFEFEFENICCIIILIRGEPDSKAGLDISHCPTAQGK